MAPHLLEDRKRKRNSSSHAAINPDIGSEYQSTGNIQEEQNPETHDAHEEISVEEEGVTEGEDDDQSEDNESLSNEESEDESKEEALVEDENSDSESKSNGEYEEEDDDSESNGVYEEENEDSESNSEYEENSHSDEETKYEETSGDFDEGTSDSDEKTEYEETSDSDEDTNVNQGGLVNMFSRLAVTSPTKDNDSTVSLHVKFVRDCLWKRHLISRSEMEDFGDEDVQFCVWRLESRLGQAVVEAHRKWAKILAHHIPLICPPTAITLSEKLYNKEIQWSEKVVEIFLTWLYCGDGYCFIQTEQELLETRVALERLLDKKFDRELGFGEDEEGAEIYGQQRKSFIQLRSRLENLKKYISELFDDGEDELPLDRRFRVNQIYYRTVKNFDSGKYGYAFFGTSTMAYRHRVLWEGLHVFNQHHVFAQDISVTFCLGPQVLDFLVGT